MFYGLVLIFMNFKVMGSKVTGDSFVKTLSMLQFDL